MPNLLTLFGVDFAGFDIPANFGAVTPAALLTFVCGVGFYPVLWAVLRYRKKMALRFNWWIFTSALSIACLGVMFVGYAMATTLHHMSSLETITMGQQANLNYALVCLSDPAKVPPALEKEAKVVLSGDLVEWQSEKGGPWITGASWARVDNPCSYHVQAATAVFNPRVMETARSATARFMVGFVFCGAILLISLAALTADSLDLDMRSVGISRRVAKVRLSGREEWILVLSTILFLPFSLFIVRLFEGSEKRSSNPPHP